MNPLAVVLGGTNAHIALLENLKARGYYTLLIDYYENPPARMTADEHLRESTLNMDAVLHTARERKAELVISTCIDQANLTACYVAERLGLPAPYSFYTAQSVTDKVVMKHIMRSHGILTADYVAVSHVNSTAWQKLRMPLVVKPADNCGSKGVHQVHQPAELKQHLAGALRMSRNGKAVVEEFIEGREVVANCFVKDRQVHLVACYEKFNIYSPHTVIQCFRSIRPVALSSTEEQALLSTCQRLSDAFGLVHTSLFLQTVLHGQKVYVIEFAPRVAGGLAYRSILLGTGFDLIDATINSFLGLDTNLNLHQSDDYITTNSIYGREGRFAAVTGHETLISERIIEELQQYKTPGMPMGRDLSSADRVAGFIVRAPGKAELFSKTAEAMNRLEILNDRDEPVMLKHLFEGVREGHIVTDAIPG